MKTNLLFVTSYTGLGGGETDLVTLAAHLDSSRFNPHLLVPAEGLLSERWREKGWPVHIQRWRGATTYFVPAIWALMPVCGAITNIIREHDIRLVHSDYHTLPMALPAARRAHVPIIWTCWGWWFHPKIWQRGFFKQPDYIFARSQAIKDGFLGDPPFMSPDDIYLLYSGVDTARFHPNVDGTRVRFDASLQMDAPVVALIARFQDVKGHDVFQSMARQVALQVPAVRFIVAGENIDAGAAGDVYKQQILVNAQTEPLLRSRLKYLGFRADTERVIAAADVVVCSSHFESYGIVNVEAMASGKPVVSTNYGGPSETVVDHETGFLVEPGDAAGLARRVIELLRDADLRARMGAAGRERVERHFSARHMADEFTRVLDKLLTSD